MLWDPLCLLYSQRLDFEVHGFDLKSIQNIKDVKVVKNLSDLCDKDIIIFMLPNGKIVQKVVDELLKKNVNR